MRDDSAIAAPASGGIAGTAAVPPRRQVSVVLTLGLLMAFGPMAIDMYLPAMPAMAVAFDAPQAAVQSTLSFFLLAFGVSQLVWGPVGDRYGRKVTAMAGILLFIVGSVGCATADTIGQLTGWRVVQALGAGAAPVMARAMVRDMFDRDRAASILSLLILVMGVAPLVAPLAGGQVLLHAGWPAVFLILAVFGALALVGLLPFRETLAPENRRTLDPATLVQGYLILLRDRRFLGYCLSAALPFAGIFAYISGSPFILIDHFGISPQLFGIVFGANVIGILGVSVLNSRLVIRHGADRILALGTLLNALTALLLLALGGFGVGGMVGFLLPLLLFTATIGLVAANATASAMQAFPQMAGTASALAGTIQLGFGALSGLLVGFLADGTPLPMTAVIAGAALGGLAANRLMVRGAA